MSNIVCPIDTFFERWIDFDEIGECTKCPYGTTTYISGVVGPKACIARDEYGLFIRIVMSMFTVFLIYWVGSGRSGRRVEPVPSHNYIHLMNAFFIAFSYLFMMMIQFAPFEIHVSTNGDYIPIKNTWGNGLFSNFIIWCMFHLYNQYQSPPRQVSWTYYVASVYFYIIMFILVLNTFWDHQQVTIVFDKSTHITNNENIRNKSMTQAVYGSDFMWTMVLYMFAHVLCMFKSIHVLYDYNDNNTTVMMSGEQQV